MIDSGDIHSIDEICEKMNRFRPTTRRNGYRRVASEWVRECVVTLADLVYERRDEDGSFRLPVDELKEILNRHYTDESGCSRQWGHWLSENFPLWITVKRGYSGLDRNGRRHGPDAFHTLAKPIPGLFERAEELLEEMEPHSMHAFHRRRVDVRMKRIRAQGRQGFSVRQQRVCPSTIARCLENAPDGPHRASLKRILVHSDPSGAFPVIERRGENGRVYHRGMNLQTASGIVRRAALGPTIRIDAKVCSWRFFEMELGEPGGEAMVRMLQDRGGFRRTLARDVCGEATEESVSRIKKAITALPFGIGLNPRFADRSGLRLILDGPEEVDAFLRHPSIVELRAVRNRLHRIMKETFRRKRGIPRDLFRSDGSPDAPRALSYLYNRYEQSVRRCMVRVAEDVFGRGSVLLQVHDGIFVSGGGRDMTEAMDMARMAFISGDLGKFAAINPLQEFEVDLADPLSDLPAGGDRNAMAGIPPGIRVGDLPRDLPAPPAIGYPDPMRESGHERNQARRRMDWGDEGRTRE